MMTYALGGEAAWYQPPDPGPECLWCDGGKMVDVVAVATVTGESENLKEWGLAVEVPCPRCIEHPGVEPVAEREDR